MKTQYPLLYLYPVFHFIQFLSQFDTLQLGGAISAHEFYSRRQYN